MRWDLGRPEAPQLEVAVPGEEDVFGSDIPMDDFPGVQVLEGQQQLQDPLGDGFLRQGGLVFPNQPPDVVGQVALLAVFLDQVDVVLLDDDVVEGHDVGVLDALHHGNLG
jgi:hypothetical protein